VDDASEIGLVQDLLVLSGAEEEGGATEVVDLAGDTFAVVVDASDEAVAEDGILAACHAQVMLDVACGFLQVEGFEVKADGNALVEGLVGGEAEPVREVRLSQEDEGDRGSGVHVVVEEEAELVEEVWGQEVGLVDDEEDMASLAGQVLEGGAELGQHADEAEGRLGLEGEEDVAVEAGGREVGVGEVDDGVEVTVKGVGEGAGGGGLAGADIAGEECREAVLESEEEAALSLAVATGGEEVVGGDGLAEGRQLEAVSVIETGHGCSPGR
jgi:hypothetical protein